MKAQYLNENVILTDNTSKRIRSAAEAGLWAHLYNRVQVWKQSGEKLFKHCKFFKRSTDSEEMMKKKIIEALKNGYKPLPKQN